MNNRDLLRWGSRSAHIAVVLLTISIASYWVTGGLDFKAWIPLFSAFTCFLLVASLAAYEHLACHEYSLARVGAAFGALTIFTFLLEAVAWGADRLIRAASPAASETFTPMLALFTSLHTMVIWLIIFWTASWGVGFIRLGGRSRLAGIFLSLGAGFHAVDYVLLRMGQAGLHVELWHLGSQLILLGAFGTLGVVLLEASRAGVEQDTA